MKPRLLTDSDRKKVVSELIDIMREARSRTFRITMEDQDVHLAIERRLTEELGDLGKKVHTARSRNDQVAVDLRLYGKGHIVGAIAEASALAESLVDFAEAHAGLPMVGRTHMQPAMPSSVGLWASAHAESLLDDIALLVTAYELNDQCPLGSAASYGVPLPIDRELVARLLGFSRPHHNVLYANNARGKIESFILSVLSQVMLSVSRFAQDLILFTMPEFGYFRLPPAFCTGSSIMPQKQNPDVLELVRARAAKVLAFTVAVLDIVKSSPSGYNRDLQETKQPFMEGMAATRATLRVLRPMIEQLEVNGERMLAAFTPDVFAADRALELVASGVPFRDAYHYVKEHLDELSVADAAEAIAKKTHLGGTAGLDFPLMRRRLRDSTSFAQEERAGYNKAISHLLGVKYPLRAG
jgi:argininosuccinate lyase